MSHNHISSLLGTLGNLMYRLTRSEADKSLEHKVLEILHRENEGKNFLVKARVTPKCDFLDAQIDTRHWNILLELNPKLEEQLKVLPAAMLGSTNLFDDLITAAFNHEIGHNASPEGYYGCPADELYFSGDIGAAKRALGGMGVTAQREIDLVVPMIVNFFEDYVVNVTYALSGESREKFRRGITAFYLLASSLEKKFRSSPLSAMLLDVQFKTYWQKDELRRFAAETSENYLPELTEKTLDIFTQDKDLTQKVLANTMAAPDYVKLFWEISQPKHWAGKVYKFTKLVYPLLKKELQEGLGGLLTELFGDSCFTQRYREDRAFREKISQEMYSMVVAGTGLNSRGKALPKKSYQGYSESPFKPSTPETAPTANGPAPADQSDFEKSVSEVGKRRQVTTRRVPQRASGTDGFEYQPLPPWVKPNTCDHGLGGTMAEGRFPLDFNYAYDFYSQGSRVLKVPLIPNEEKEIPQLEVAYASAREINPAGLGVDFDKIAWDETIIDPNGDFHLYQKEAPITVPMEAQLQQLAFDRDILFIGDISASMGYLQVVSRERLVAPQVNELQGYDCFCILATSLVQTAEELGLGKINYAALLLGNQTHFYPWTSSKKKVLDYIYSGYADACLQRLSPQEVEHAINTHQKIAPQKKILAVMLGDGYAQWGENKMYLMAAQALLRAGHEFIYIQYNGGDFRDLGITHLDDQDQLRPLAQELKKQGQQVFQIKTYKDLFEIDYDLKIKLE